MAKETWWHIIEWLIIILVVVLVIFTIIRFDLIGKIKDVFPSFGK